jgi:hypothetical protein
MQSKRMVSSEGASTPYYRPPFTEVPALVVFPVSLGMGVVPADAQWIYEMALERARAACAPSVWALAQRVCVN